ncbi:hypothetical protein [Paraburkholderia sp. DHOC27]|uniref:hypothetical protein n=1 Tax=Paraburkholderia sp. DHOC27 TaxID=2303330 RepID=UPI0011C1B4E4|nr:hypothetical protein [Paraburkholderia sp. DHOC27]
MEPLRAVRTVRGRQTTITSAACAVDGAICFMRAGASGQGSRFVRIFNLVPPEPFGDGLVVFGLSSAVVERLRRDGELVQAVNGLVKSGGRLTLQKNKLTFTIGNTAARKLKDVRDAYVGTAALRLEILFGTHANDAIGVRALSLPYTIYSVVGASAFSFGLAFLTSTLTPLKIAGCSLLLSLLFILVLMGMIVPGNLRRNALGGAAAFSVVLAVTLGSLALGTGLAMFSNTWLGERFLPVQRVRLSGVVAITRGKHTNCWLDLDQPSSTLVPGMSIRELPLRCRDVHYHADALAQNYDIEINPGLLGAPFVQSIRAAEDESN